MTFQTNLRDDAVALLRKSGVEAVCRSSPQPPGPAWLDEGGGPDDITVTFNDCELWIYEDGASLKGPSLDRRFEIYDFDDLDHLKRSVLEHVEASLKCGENQSPKEQRYSNWISWTVFTIVNLASNYFDRYLWMLERQRDIIHLLGVISVALGVWIVFASNTRWRSAVTVLIVLIIGQLGLIESLATMLIWSINGFAP